MTFPPVPDSRRVVAVVVTVGVANIVVVGSVVETRRHNTPRSLRELGKSRKMCVIANDLLRLQRGKSLAGQGSYASEIFQLLASEVGIDIEALVRNRPWLMSGGVRGKVECGGGGRSARGVEVVRGVWKMAGTTEAHR